MITQSDTKKLEQIFVTKVEFEKKTDKIISMLDEVMGELRSIREDTTVFAYRQSDHSDRIERLELKVFGTSFA